MVRLRYRTVDLGLGRQMLQHGEQITDIGLDRRVCISIARRVARFTITPCGGLHIALVPAQLRDPGPGEAGVTYLYRWRP